MLGTPMWQFQIRRFCAFAPGSRSVPDFNAKVTVSALGMEHGGTRLEVMIASRAVPIGLSAAFTSPAHRPDKGAIARGS